MDRNRDEDVNKAPKRGIIIWNKRERNNSTSSPSNCTPSKNYPESSPDLEQDRRHVTPPYRPCKSDETLSKTARSMKTTVLKSVAQTVISSVVEKPSVESRTRRVREFGEVSKLTEPFICSLYLADYRTALGLDVSGEINDLYDGDNDRGNSSRGDFEKDGEGSTLGNRLDMDHLVRYLSGILLLGRAKLQETACGLIAEFSRLEDADKVASLPLAKIFGEKIVSWRILNRQQRRRYSRTVLVRDIPETVPTAEIQNALRFQGLRPGRIVRHSTSNLNTADHPPAGTSTTTYGNSTTTNNTTTTSSSTGFRIEILSAYDLDRVQREGVNFFNVAAFPVCVLGNNSHSNNSSSNPVDQQDGRDKGWNSRQFGGGGGGGGEGAPADIVQCYRCQRFWHKAAQCKYSTRCVRCGAKHKVNECIIPMNRAVCCLCRGPHHAAYKDCPVRRQYCRAVQVAFAMATNGKKKWDTGKEFFK